MDPERATKRARVDASAGEAAGTSSAGPSGEQTENAFDVLPDELVQRIMSFVDAREAWEVSRMQQVDRRFRRLVRGVEWEKMRMALKPLVLSQPEGHQQQVLRALQMIRRMTERLRRGEMLGARRVSVSLVSIDVEDDFPPALVKLMINVADAILALVAALAVAPLPLDHIDFGGNRLAWPSDNEQRAAGLNARSIHFVASSLLVGLSPAKTLRSLSASRDLARSLAEACNDFSTDHTPAAETLRELVFKNTGLSTNAVAAIVRTWPALRRAKLGLDGGAGLAELARLPLLEAVEVTLKQLNDHNLERGIAALAGASGSATRLRELWLMYKDDEEHFDRVVPVAVVKESIATILSLRSLQRLSVGVAYDSTEAIGGLAALEQLRELDLYLYLGDNTAGQLQQSTERSAALLDAAAAALEKARALERLRLFIRCNCLFGALQPSVAGALVSLIRAGRPCLVELLLSSAGLLASPELFREIALCGPRLVSVSLAFELDSAHDLAPFRELLNLSKDRLPSFRLQLKIRMNMVMNLYEGDARPPVEATLTSWFSRMPSISLEFPVATSDED